MESLLNACKPAAPVIKIGSYIKNTPQEKANRAWKSLGKKMGFDSSTVRPIPEKDDKFFSAVPSETEMQRDERLKREVKEKKEAEIKQLTEEILERQNKLGGLLNHG